MDTRNAPPLNAAPPGAGPWQEPTRATPSGASSPPALHTPLVWAWGSALLTATLWLTGMIALFRAIASLFD
ncbi:hypothetical protein [Roseicella frigidaeris]|uniref:DUF2474 domain-containing protein n=1 Tax=Roseicella frigidaeris TaxID=2230885 RepID=A0A327MJM8_9PROT|nr:hypothetical protein [Roseicella frigidaeris]RAI60368.1 hypothetical protein DOO78_04670 [Roseicella frigidaeris]